MLEREGKFQIYNDIGIRRRISKYVIENLIWDLRSRDINIKVNYYKGDKLIFSKFFVFEGKEEIDVNELIDHINKIHQ